MSNKNPYSQAAGAYVKIATATDQRTMEATVLLQAAQKLEDLARRLQDGEKVRLEELGEILNHNQKLWQLFVSDMDNPDHHLPQDLRNNVASLAFFVFKHTQDILVETLPEKFQVLININRCIAAGLMKKPDAATAAKHTQAPEAKMVSDNIA